MTPLTRVMFRRFHVDSRILFIAKILAAEARIDVTFVGAPDERRVAEGNGEGSKVSKVGKARGNLEGYLEVRRYNPKYYTVRRYL